MNDNILEASGLVLEDHSFARSRGRLTPSQVERLYGVLSDHQLLGRPQRLWSREEERIANAVTDLLIMNEMASGLVRRIVR